MIPQVKIRKEQNKKNIITAGMGDRMILTKSEQQWSISNMVSQIGNQLSLKEGKILIGDNINYILINVQIRTNDGFNNRRSCKIISIFK